MGVTSANRRSTSVEQTPRATQTAPGWYYPVVGVLGGAAVVALGLLPRQAAGILLVVAAVLVAIASFAASLAPGRSLSIAPGPGVIVYLVVLAIVLIGSLVLNGTVVRGSGAPWSAWILGAAVFVVALAGNWVLRPGRSRD